MALEADQWAQIRRVWEYDPDQPTFGEAGRRAAAKFGFTSPAKQVIARRAAAEKWERMGAAAMSDVAAGAMRKADSLAGDGAAQGGEGDGQGDGVGAAGVAGVSSTPGKKPADATAARSSAEEAEDLRAKVIARHRQEWIQVGALRQEALARRPKMIAPGVFQAGAGTVAEAFEAAKLAKITAEMTSIQQAGERKAWGLDVIVDPDQLKTMSEADLIRLAQGKPLKG